MDCRSRGIAGALPAPMSLRALAQLASPVLLRILDPKPRGAIRAPLAVRAARRLRARISGELSTYRRWSRPCKSRTAIGLQIRWVGPTRHLRNVPFAGPPRPPRLVLEGHIFRRTPISPSRRNRSQRFGCQRLTTTFHRGDHANPAISTIPRIARLASGRKVLRRRGLRNWPPRSGASLKGGKKLRTKRSTKVAACKGLRVARLVQNVAATRGFSPSVVFLGKRQETASIARVPRQRAGETPVPPVASAPRSATPADAGPGPISP
jgi:hypothetical protein